MENIQRFQGIGPSLATSLMCDLISLGLVDKTRFMENGYTKRELRKMLQGELYSGLPTTTQIDIDFQPTQRIPRHVIDRINEILGCVSGIKWKIAGSYLRGKAYSKDIDIVISKGNRRNVWNDWTSQIPDELKIYEPYASGPSKINTIFEIRVLGKRYRIRVDVFLALPEEWVYALLYATGSGQFNIRMRAKAKYLGYKLNQRCLIKDNECILLSERRLFKTLGMKYIAPENR